MMRLNVAGELDDRVPTFPRDGCRRQSRSTSSSVVLSDTMYRVACSALHCVVALPGDDLQRSRKVLPDASHSLREAHARVHLMMLVLVRELATFT